MMPVIIRQKEVLGICRPNGIPVIVSRNCVPKISLAVLRLYRLSLKSGVVAMSWKLVNVQLVPKTGSRADPVSCRPVSIISILCNTIERVLNNSLLSYLEDRDLLCDRQNGVRPTRAIYGGPSCTSIRLSFMERGYRRARQNSCSVFTHFKRFDRFWHVSLLSKLPAYRLPTGLCNCISDFLSDRSIRGVL